MVFDCKINLNSDKIYRSNLRLYYKDNIIFSLSGYDSDGLEGTGHDVYTISDAIFGMIFSLSMNHLYCDIFPWPELIKNKDMEGYSIATSIPLFIPVCSIGCCGFRDFSISVNGKIINMFIGDLNNDHANIQKYEVPLEEYVDVLLKCIDAIKDDKSEKLEYVRMLWLLEKIGIEGSKEYREIIIPKIYNYCKTKNLGI